MSGDKIYTHMDTLFLPLPTLPHRRGGRRGVRVGLIPPTLTHSLSPSPKSKIPKKV